VLVTHHVEEITAVFSHIMILKSGRVLASGRKTGALTSRILSEAFNTPIRLTRKRSRYSLSVSPRKDVVI
jgi:iron complex transport system ATP-binding protein